ncbi:minor capsid protein [Lactobacillus gigeriorum]|uniref:Phage protein F-like protein n=1 Tax=Lactobacillus gigeriorum DSM 23908 = CRBIP 24.85 TaxID=1423751 RepID=I7J255_9LACO|nr:minor capsid protein [Lactobacillus gigeriorum]KRN10145.1 phage protein F-like protein [Lactobacillus gigeriorum DSM 23908 = CRBIP 24.85]CCI86687.1 Putative phage head protein [Lactobacillus gigeriorum DSM 23908 = CRBIP 24.85]
MNSQEYWKKRALLAKQKEMASNAEYEIAMRSRLKDLENEFIKESKKWVTKYANENNQSLKEAADYLNSIDTSKFDMTLAEFEAKARAGGFEKELNSAYYKTRIARLQELYRQYQKLAARYADNEEDNMAIGLAKRYEDTYLLENYNKYLVVGGLDVNFAHFNEQELKDIVYQPWKGGNFSKRIWNNYTKVMPEVLTDVMFRSTALGYSYNRVERMLRDKFQGVVKSNIHRLVITEMGHAAEKATAEFYEDSDIEQYQYLATLETHTCEVCAHLDERVFNVKDEKEGVNYPLMHPYCRCTTVPYMKDLPDIPTRWYRDPVTGKGKWTRNMNYSEWKRTVKEQQSEKEYADLVGKFGIHGFPESAKEYNKLLYNKRTGRALNAYVKARERGTVEPVVTYQDYIDAMDRLNDEVVGTTASNGQVVKDFSDHLIDRIFGVKKDPQGHRREGVSIDKIKELLQSAERTTRIDSTPFRDDDAYVVLSDKGRLVTVVPRKRRNKKWKH